MASIALADALRDFGSRVPRAAPERNAPAVIIPAAPAIDIDAIVATEVERTETAVTERLSAIYESTLQAERDQHADEMLKLRAELGSRAGDLISSRLTALEQQLIDTTGEAVARFLASIASDALLTKSIGALASAISEAIADRDTVKIRISGPQSLYEPLTAALGDRVLNIEYTETGVFDLKVDIDGNLYETRLSEWAATIAGVVA